MTTFGIGRAAVLAEEWTREERITWRRSLEGRAGILEHQIGHETCHFNGMAEGGATQRYGGHPWHLIIGTIGITDSSDLYVRGWNRIVRIMWDLADYDGNH